MAVISARRIFERSLALAARRRLLARGTPSERTGTSVAILRGAQSLPIKHSRAGRRDVKFGGGSDWDIWLLGDRGG